MRVQATTPPQSSRQWRPLRAHAHGGFPTVLCAPLAELSPRVRVDGATRRGRVGAPTARWTRPPRDRQGAHFGCGASGGLAPRRALSSSWLALAPSPSPAPVSPPRRRLCPSLHAPRRRCRRRRWPTLRPDDHAPDCGSLRSALMAMLHADEQKLQTRTWRLGIERRTTGRNVGALASRSDTPFSLLTSLSYVAPRREPIDIHCGCPN